MTQKKPLRWLAVFVITAVVAVFLTSTLWMAALGRYLVLNQEPIAADAVVVLAGDFSGHRILKAADLVRQGYAPKVLVSGPAGLYGRNEADLAVEFAVAHGYPREWFEVVPHHADSTREEEAVIQKRLQDEHVRRFLLVTSNYHSRRAARVWRSANPPAEFRVIAADDRYFEPESWWRTRPGRKALFTEWLKTIADWFGI